VNSRLGLAAQSTRKETSRSCWGFPRFSPRRPRSKWSKVNRQKATELVEKGEMKPAGVREVEWAKADGRWDAANDAQSTATVPDDLQTGRC